MEITNEIILKVFAQYLGSCKFIDPINYTELLSVSVLKHENLPNFKLILKPISEITNEDAIEVAVIAGMVRPMNRFEFVISRHINYAKHILSDYFKEYRPVEDEITGNVWLSIYQFLQSKGYDTPQYLLGGKTLEQSGLAIYEY